MPLIGNGTIWRIAEIVWETTSTINTISLILLQSVLSKGIENVYISEYCSGHIKTVVASKATGDIETGTERGLFRGLIWGGPLHIGVSKPGLGTMETKYCVIL